jgi:type I restriction enzyme S subunit
MGNLDHGTIRLDLREVQHVQPPAGAEGSRTRVREGDILVSITAELGMTALVPENVGEAYVNQHVALLRLVGGLTPAYIAWFVASERGGQVQLREMKRGATKLGLGLDDLRSVTVPLPPLAEQLRIVAEVERRVSIIEDLEATVEANLKRAERLRQSILKRAFEGKLVPQEPTDEPASVLLERIRAERTASSVGKSLQTRRSLQAGTRQPALDLAG